MIVYGFRKVSEADFPIHGPRRNPDGWQFRHDQFRRNAESALQHVQRRRSVCRTIISGSPTSPPPSSSHGLVNKRPAFSTMTPMKQEYELADDTSHGSNNETISDCLVRLNDMLENVQSRTTNIHHALGQLRVAQTQQQELLASVVTFATSLIPNDSSTANNEAINRLKLKLLAQHNPRVDSMPVLDEPTTQYIKHNTRPSPTALATADKNNNDGVSLVCTSEPGCESSPSASTLQLPPIYSRPVDYPLNTNDQTQYRRENNGNTKHATIPFVTLPCINAATTVSTATSSIHDGSITSGNNNSNSLSSPSSSLPTLRSLALP
ncbi:hypothetical protein K492DRAFT_195610 [Lichtheimia hyalospora FSU 10163]|nr:hypothetical protein K492DRAFT_195610 [Lichtheimia hyalospora FSU 10163]